MQNKSITLPLGAIPSDLASKAIALTDNARIIFEKRYVRKDENGDLAETINETFWRVASNVAYARKQFGGAHHMRDVAIQYFHMLSDLDFLPNSPTWTGAGTPLGQLSACFVLPVEDDMGKHPDGIFNTLRNAALIQQSGGGNGFSFGRLRSKGSRVSTSNGIATGPVGFMKAYDAAFGVIAQGGARRGANMGILPVHHPDIFEFIRAKAVEGEISNFNISVAITDDFMVAVENDDMFDLVDPASGEVVSTVRARGLFDEIVTYAHRNGEPGVVFIDRANAENPVPHIAEYEATNPCSEQWLLPYESCNLGSINLANHTVATDARESFIDWKKLEQTVRLATQFLDDVVQVNTYVESVPQLREAALRTRRIGLGVMGFADMLVKCNESYRSARGNRIGRDVMEFVRYHCMNTSVDLAIERGSFPAIEGSIYDRENFRFSKSDIRTQDVSPSGSPISTNGVHTWERLIQRIKEHGIRNAAQVTIAPTGTISSVAGVEGYGCEPIFALAYTRYVQDGDGHVELQYISPLLRQKLEAEGFTDDQIEAVAQQVSDSGTCQGVDEIPEYIRDYLVVAGDIAPEDHVRMQAAFQVHNDSAVSKTCNLPAGSTVDDVRKIYQFAHQMGCKGITVYVTGSRNKVVLETNGTRKNKEVTDVEDVSGCPECGGMALLVEGCVTCHDCGYSACTV